MSEREGQNAGQNLISKKDVLDKFKISYGQFYRWKRKGLIPEPWFIRKSTYTGQETFLPKEKIVERIETIMRLKEDYSLEEIAELLFPEGSENTFDPGELASELISPSALKRFMTMTGQEGPLPFRDVIGIVVLGELDSYGLSQEEERLALETLRSNELPVNALEADWSLWLIRKPGKMSLCCIAPKFKVRFDPESNIVAEIDLVKLVEDTKLSLRGA